MLEAATNGAAAIAADPVAAASEGLTDPVHDGEILELFGAASRRLGRSVRFDASVWVAADPATGVPTAPIRFENLQDRKMSNEQCIRVWETEYLTEDVTPFSELARAELPAGALRLATRGRPARSPRYRQVLQTMEFGDELRVVLRVDGRPWGLVFLYRDEGRPGFDEDEVVLAGGLSEPLGRAIRERTRLPAAFAEADRGPGLILVTADWELASVNEDALAWLDELPSDLDRPARLAGKLPMAMIAITTQARAIAQGCESGVARVRMRSRTGRWLVCHASCMRNSDGTLGHAAVVIEPAKAAEIAPIIVRAYELTAREEEIVGLISRGLATTEIALQLHLSRHTVRDYVKAIFDKLGVSSRGELVAKLFAEHYHPIHAVPGRQQYVDQI